MNRPDVFPRHVLATCAVAASVLFAPLASAGPNLIVNGGGEAGPGSTNGNEVIVAPGWATQNNSNFTVVDYTAPNGGPTPVSPGPTDRGMNYFSGGPDNEASSATQLIDLSFAASAIAAGGAGFTLSGWLGGYSGQDDHTLLSASWLDSQGMALGSFTLDSVYASDRAGETGLLFKTFSGALDSQVRQVLITLDMRRTDGAYNDGSADNLSFSLTDVTAPNPVPEPSTYALMLGGLASVAAFARRRNARRCE